MISGLTRVWIVLGALLHCSLLAQPSASASDGAPVAADQSHSFHVIKDVLYQNQEPTERADIYLPTRASAAAPVPAVIWMHGNHHTKAEARERNVCCTLASVGYVALSINYGTWPDSDIGEEQSPRILQNIANARNAVRFLRAHASDYNADPARIALFGGSAGGWLALMVGLTKGDTAFDTAGPYPGMSSAVNAIGDFYADVDPWLKSKITAQSPPVLIIQGKADPAVDYHDSIELRRLLEKAGVPQELVLLENVGHAFDLTTWQKKPLPKDLRPVVLEFLAKHVGAPPGDSIRSPLASAAHGFSLVVKAWR